MTTQNKTVHTPTPWLIWGNNMKMIAWNVYLNDKLIDTVFYTKDCDAEYVKRSLIEHDGYNPKIEVFRGK